MLWIIDIEINNRYHLLPITLLHYNYMREMGIPNTKWILTDDQKVYKFYFQRRQGTPLLVNLNIKTEGPRQIPAQQIPMRFTDVRFVS